MLSEATDNRLLDGGYLIGCAPPRESDGVARMFQVLRTQLSARALNQYSRTASVRRRALQTTSKPNLDEYSVENNVIVELDREPIYT